LNYEHPSIGKTLPSGTGGDNLNILATGAIRRLDDAVNPAPPEILKDFGQPRPTHDNRLWSADLIAGRALVRTKH
jgi:hypothetical protein